MHAVHTQLQLRAEGGGQACRCAAGWGEGLGGGGHAPLAWGGGAGREGWPPHPPSARPRSVTIQGGVGLRRNRRPGGRAGVLACRVATARREGGGRWRRGEGGPRRPRHHELADREPRRAWVLPPAQEYRCCGGGWGAPGAGSTAYHTANHRGMEATSAAAAACGSQGGARGLSPRRKHRMEPPWLIPTQRPPEPCTPSSQPSTRSTIALCRARGPMPHRPGGGGEVPCRHTRVHDCGCALPEHPCGVAVPLGSASGRTPAPPSCGGGGGYDLATSGV